MKDKSLKDEVKYELHSFSKCLKEWIIIGEGDTRKGAVIEKQRIEKLDKEYCDGCGYHTDAKKFRIVKCTIKKEVVG